MKPILIINKPHSVLTEGLEEHGIPFETDYTSSYDAIVSKLGDYDGIIIRSRISLDAQLLKHAHHLKFIAREGVGLDHIDTDYCERYGIPVLPRPMIRHPPLVVLYFPTFLVVSGTVPSGSMTLTCEEGTQIYVPARRSIARASPRASASSGLPGEEICAEHPGNPDLTVCV